MTGVGGGAGHRGVVMHTYEAAGAPVFGSVQPGDVISES